MKHKEIIIVGAGPVGLIAALCLAKAGKSVAVLDRDINSQSQDGRVLALSYASCELLRELGLWDISFATQITQVHISHSGLGVSRIKAENINLPELGFTISYSDLSKKLKSQVSNYPQIELINALVKQVIPGDKYATISYGEDILEHMSADLVILAEGGKIQQDFISYREYDYGQSAIIARIRPKIYHDIAFERFDDSGSLVMLPYQKHYVMIWIKNNIANNQNRLINSLALKQELDQLGFMKRFGEFIVDDKIHSFLLKLQVADKRVYNQVILVGSSAQIVHPISAQGLNLGIRDLKDMLQILDENNYDYSKLYLYNKKRMMDAGFVTKFTHILAKLLEYPSIKHIRGLGLIGFSNIKPLQNKVARALIFGN